MNKLFRRLVFFSMLYPVVFGPPLLLAEKERLPVSEPNASDEDVIRFVILSDRTGGMRRGVFADALEKANGLHPEFVISVGDLIDGYTLEPSLLDAQWLEFDRMVEQLDIPFYYVPGNHDISNPWMEEQWKQRLGMPYYHFLYKDALFVALHTEDGGTSGISEEQARYVVETLRTHPDVRWTFLFMHRPLWSYGDKQGFEPIESALRGRRYTLFSGHHHNYYYEPDADGNERFVLATSGGGSAMRGVDVGEFDHLTHVALSGEGPKVTHLLLDGFVAKDVVNPRNRGVVETLRHGSFFEVEPSVLDEAKPERAVTRLLFRNPNDQRLSVRIRVPQIQNVRFELESEALEIGPKGLDSVRTALVPEDGVVLDLKQLPLIEIGTEGSYQTEAGEVRLPARKVWRLDWLRRVTRFDDKPEMDGVLNEWLQSEWVDLDPPGYFEEGWDWKGLEDCRIAFSFRRDGDALYFAARVEDDRFILTDANLRDRLSLFFRTGERDISLEFEPYEGGGLGVSGDIDPIESSMRLEDGALTLEVALPIGLLGRLGEREDRFRFNLKYLDHDREENQKPSRLYWKPAWSSAASYEGSGTFLLE